MRISPARGLPGEEEEGDRRGDPPKADNHPGPGLLNISASTGPTHTTGLGNVKR